VEIQGRTALLRDGEPTSSTYRCAVQTSPTLEAKRPDAIPTSSDKLGSRIEPSQKSSRHSESRTPNSVRAQPSDPRPASPPADRRRQRDGSLSSRRSTRAWSRTRSPESLLRWLKSSYRKSEPPVTPTRDERGSDPVTAWNAPSMYRYARCVPVDTRRDSKQSDQ
jgi:hypothetical protein